MVSKQNINQKINVITIPGGGKGFSGYNIELNFTEPNDSFYLTRAKINQLDSQGPEGWWRSYIPLIVKGKPIVISHKPNYLDALKRIGLKFNEELVR